MSLRDFASITSEDAERLAASQINYWLWYRKVKNEQGNPIEFDQHHFLFDIYADCSPLIVCKKAAQVGWSTLAVIKSLWLAKHLGMEIVYTMPTSDDAREFVSGKVNRIIRQNPILREYVKDHDSIEQKQVGNSIIHYRGTWTDRQALSVPSDLNIYDEVDRSKQDVIAAYASRLQASKYQWQWYFSNPSTPTNGVGKLWDESDCREWFIRCRTCQFDQVLRWPASIDPERGCYQCTQCHAALSDDERMVGEWRATSEGKYRGYHLSLLMAPWTPATKILELERTKTVDYFHNFVIAEPYAVGGLPDFRRLFLDCYTTRNLREEPFALGVDIGATKHYVLGSKSGIFQIGKFTDREDLEWLIERYNPTVVMDAGPERTWAEEFRRKYPKLSICFYRRDSTNADIAQWGEDDKRGTVTADRNRLIDHVIDQFLQANLMLNLPTAQFDEYIRHWMTLQRVKTQDALGVDRYVWESPTGLDHFCFVADTIIRTAKGDKRIADVRVGDFVLTRDGYKRVLRSWCSRKNAKVVTAEFSNGATLTATQDHRIFVDDKGFVSLDAMTYGDTIFHICQAKQLNTTESSLGDTLIQRIERSDATLSRMGRIGRKVLDDCMRRFGKPTMGQFLTEALSIIKTKIHSIMPLRILFASLDQNTNGNTFFNDSQTQQKDKGIKNILPVFGISENRGIGQKMVWRIIKKMQNIFIQKRGKRSLPASCVSKHIEHGTQGITPTVGNDARRKQTASGMPITFVRMRDNGTRADVYNLSVEDVHEYFANGILVSNCHATSYYVLALKKAEPSQFIKAPSEQKQNFIERTPDGFRMRDLRDMFSR